MKRSADSNLLISVLASCVPAVAQVLFLRIYFDAPAVNGQRYGISENAFLAIQIAIAAAWLAMVLPGAYRIFWKGLFALLSAPVVLGPPLFWGAIAFSCRFNFGCF